MFCKIDWLFCKKIYNIFYTNGKIKMQNVFVSCQFGHGFGDADYVYVLREQNVKDKSALPRRLREKPDDVDLDSFLENQKICILTSPAIWEEVRKLLACVWHEPFF